jgi:plastocyanin
MVMAARRAGYGIVCAAVLALGAAGVARADDGIVIVIKDGKFSPSEVPVPAGQKVKLLVRNQDSSMSEFESSDFHREKTVGPGQEISVFVGPLDAGSYEFFDDFHPTDRGHLVVK